jgi:hypothetical protein
MGETITIRTGAATEVIKVIEQGPQGPQGPAGTGLTTLTTAGDMLYRDASGGQRLPIGTAGQILKVNSGGTAPEWGAPPASGVSSVNGETGAVTITAASIDAAADNHTHSFSDINVNGVLISGAGNANANGPYLYSGDFGDRGAYHKDKDSLIYWDGDAWLINVNGDDRYSSTQDVSFPYQVTSWSVLPGTGTAPAPTSNARLSGQEFEEIVGQRVNPTLRGDAAGKNVGTGANDVAAGNDSRFTDARQPLSHSSTHHTGGTDALELASLAATGAGADDILASDGDGTASWRTLSTFIGESVGPADIGAAQASHTHGNLTNAGAIGTTANLPLKTGTNGVIEAGSFGTAAGSFAAGDDVRFSDARTPTAHKASHAINGTDFLAPSDIGAQSIFATEDLGTITANVTLTAARAKIYLVNSQTSGLSINLPTTSIMAGDVVQIRFTSFTGETFAVRRNGSFYGSSLTNGQQATYIAASTSANSWEEAANNRHSHGNITNEGRIGTTSGLPVQTISGGIVSVGAFGTSAGQFAEGNHTHVVADVSGAAASGSITTSGLTQATARILGRTSSSTGAIEEIQIGSGLSLSAGELSATGSGVTAVGASTADVLSVSGSDLVADDPNADRIVFWDDSESKWRYLEAGSGLTISGTTMTASGGIGGGTGSTDNSILRSDGTGGSTLQDSAFVIADNATASPNNTVNHASIQATGGTTNVSVSIVPKGTGAFMLQVPDGTSTGGNARGANAIDLQTSRTSATQVASGFGSVCIGRNCSTAHETGIAIGVDCSTSLGNGYGVAIGRSNAVNTTAGAAIGGQQHNISGREGFIGAGSTHSVSGAGGAIIGGEYGVADRAMIQVQSCGRFAASGDAQRISVVLRGKTTTNTAVELLTAGFITSSTRLTIPSGKVMAMLVNITGVKSDGSAVAHYVRQYAIKNVGGTTSEVYAPVTIGTDNAVSTSIAISANDTNDALKIECTGIASETWRWVASVDAVEVAYGS